MAARHRRQLTELAEIGLSMARILRQDMLATKDPAVARELRRTLARVTREIGATCDALAALDRSARSRARTVRAVAHRTSQDTLH